MSESQHSPEQNSETELLLSDKLEAILFVAAEPVPTAQLAAALDVTPSVIEFGGSCQLHAPGVSLQTQAPGR